MAAMHTIGDDGKGQTKSFKFEKHKVLCLIYLLYCDGLIHQSKNSHYITTKLELVRFVGNNMYE